MLQLWIIKKKLLLSVILALFSNKNPIYLSVVLLKPIQQLLVAPIQ